MNLDYKRAALAILAGSVVNFTGDLLLGARVEFFYGIATFTFPWMLDVFLVPFVAGLVTALVYRERGGKWLAFLPPILVRCLNLVYLYFTNDQWNENFSFHLHLHYWGLVVILAAEAANLGGSLGEARNGAYLRNNNPARPANGGASGSSTTENQITTTHRR